MTRLSVTAIEDRCAVFLPPEALARLQAGAGDEVTLIESPNGLELVADPEVARQLEVARGVMQDDADALAKLAE